MTDIALFIDWRSAVHGGLRPKVVPSQWKSHPETLGEILKALRSEIEILLGDKEAIVDTYIYGGFTETNGDDSDELKALTEALGTIDWSGRSQRLGARFRHLDTVVTVHPDGEGGKIHALHRSRIRVPNAQVRIRGEECSCNWLAATRKVFSESLETTGMRCPECGRTRIEVERRGQKLVDTLMAVHIVRRAYGALENSEDLESWVLSDDADLLPALCLSASVGIGTVWLRGRPLVKYGYRELALNAGIDLREITNVEN